MEGLRKGHERESLRQTSQTGLAGPRGLTLTHGSSARRAQTGPAVSTDKELTVSSESDDDTVGFDSGAQHKQ
ncbi:hypothetical protein ACLOJK_035854 [Asimina triloba]